MGCRKDKTFLNSVETEKLTKELNSFKDLWPGGFYKGDPLSPMSSPIGLFGYMGIYHVIYLTCIRPYLTENSVVLEIGPGRGAWTKLFRLAKEIWCIDALSAEHNKFWEYVGRSPNIKYFTVSDFSCNMLPDNTFTYLFSYDALCHVSFEGLTAYATNIYPKLKKGSHCFIMIGDYTKYNMFVDNIDNYSVFNKLIPTTGRPLIRACFQRLGSYINRCYMSRRRIVRLNITEDEEPKPGRWYNAGLERTCKMLEEKGYTIIDPDMGVDYRNPVIHFAK